MVIKLNTTGTENVWLSMQNTTGTETCRVKKIRSGEATTRRQREWSESGGKVSLEQDEKKPKEVCITKLDMERLRAHTRFPAGTRDVLEQKLECPE